MSIEKQIEAEFLKISLSPKTMLIYTPRTAILAGVREAAAAFSGTVLDVGCGFMPYREIIESNPKVGKYVGMDLENSALYGGIGPDLIWSGAEIPLDAESVDCVMATEFLEHHSDPENVLKEILRVMKPHGKFFATVPFIWNLHEIPHDEYRYTPYSLERFLKAAGFKSIEIKALGGWNLSFAQMIGLWLTFSKMGGIKRALLKWAIFPFYVWLIKTDRKPAKFDDWENSMFSGLSVTAEK